MKCEDQAMLLCWLRYLIAAVSSLHTHGPCVLIGRSRSDLRDQSCCSTRWHARSGPSQQRTASYIFYIFSSPCGISEHYQRDDLYQTADKVTVRPRHRSCAASRRVIWWGR